MKKKVYKGLVWSGYVGEYKHPPVYIIPFPKGIPKTLDDVKDGIFVSDIFRKFIKKKVCVTIRVISS